MLRIPSSAPYIHQGRTGILTQRNSVRNVTSFESSRPRTDDPEAGGRHAAVRSWVRADHAALDPVLYDAVRAWLDRDWLFRSIEYAPRD
jgi:hypothetical protein